MFLTCLLCQEEYSILKNHCPICEKIKRIINVYSKEKVLEILDRVCLRKSDKLQDYKIKDIKKEIEKEIEKQPIGDSSYINPNTLNKDYIEELKNKIKDY
jgi:GTP-binding protein EngB required for normal cell division